MAVIVPLSLQGWSAAPYPSAAALTSRALTRNPRPGYEEAIDDVGATDEPIREIGQWFLATGSSSMPAESIHSLAIPAMRCSFWSARVARSVRPRRRIRSATATSGSCSGSSCRSLCSVSAGWARCTRGTARSLIGLTFAAAGIGLTLITGNGIWDGLATAAIGMLLVAVSIVLAIEMTSLLIGEAASPQDVRSIEAAILDGPEIDRIIHMRTLHLGPEELLVAAKIAVRSSDDAMDIARGIDSIEMRIRAAVPIARVIYLEPDIYQGGYYSEALTPSEQVESRIELRQRIEAAVTNARRANSRTDGAEL